MTDNPFANLDALRLPPEYLRLRPQYVGVQGKYQIGELGFASKSGIKEYYKAMRNDFTLQKEITGLAVGDLTALLAKHPVHTSIERVDDRQFHSWNRQETAQHL
jgi:hypothetical protein